MKYFRLDNPDPHMEAYVFVKSPSKEKAIARVERHSHGVREIWDDIPEDFGLVEINRKQFEAAYAYVEAVEEAGPGRDMGIEGPNFVWISKIRD